MSRKFAARQSRFSRRIITLNKSSSPAVKGLFYIRRMRVFRSDVDAFLTDYKNAPGIE